MKIGPAVLLGVATRNEQNKKRKKRKEKLTKSLYVDSLWAELL
jgi:hypothetical protein